MNIIIYRSDILDHNPCADGLKWFDDMVSMQGRKHSLLIRGHLGLMWLYCNPGSRAFAAWAQSMGVLPAFNGARLDLSGLDLQWANLQGANLYGAYLYRANLYRANLYGANLYGANLYGANLEGAQRLAEDPPSLDGMSPADCSSRSEPTTMTTNIWLVSVTHSDDGDVYYAAARTREELVFVLRRAIRATYGVWLPSTTFGRRFVALVNAIPRELPDLDTIERAWPLGSPSLHITLVEVATDPSAEEHT